MLEIIKTKPGEANFYLFENVVENIYKEHKLKYTFFKNINSDFLISGYVVLKNNVPVARAVLYFNPLLTYKNKQAITVGNFECIEDEHCSSFLLAHLQEEGKILGVSFFIGPMNGSTWDDYRFSISKNEDNFFSEPYHPTYYNTLFEAFGFNPIANYVSNKDYALEYNNAAVLEKEKEFLQKGLTIRNIDLGDFENELKKLYPFISEVFKNNFLYSPITEKYFVDKYIASKKIIQDGFMLMAEDKKNKVVGFIFCFEDTFNSTEKSLVVKTAARSLLDEWKGLGHVLGNCIVRNAVKENFTSLIHAFVIENAVLFSKNFGGHSFKKYTLYGKEIS